MPLAWRLYAICTAFYAVRPLSSRMNRSIKTTGTIISRERVIAVIESIMGMQTAQIQSAYSTSLMKRTMDDAESQAISLIQDMVNSVPAPAQYAFDVYA